jgi:hypothetical protein
MNIVITGYSAPQCGSTRSPIQRGSVPQELARVLGLRHKVEIGKFVTKAERKRVRDADLLILFLTPPHNLLSRNALTAMLNAADRLNKPVLAFFDDWQIKQVASGHRTVGRHALVRVNRELGDGNPLYSGDKDLQRERHDDVSKVCAVFGPFDGRKGAWPASWHWATPVYSWGDPGVVFGAVPGNHPRDRWHGVDPSAAFTTPLINARFTPKDRAFSCVSLLNRSDWVDKLNLEWPVHYAGNRKVGERLKTEVDVVGFVGQYRGMLSPSYKYLNGSGWFRSRFQYAAHVGAVVYAEPDEVAGLDGYHVPIDEIQSSTDRRLTNLASRQGKIFTNASWDMRTLERRLDKLVKKVAS